MKIFIDLGAFDGLTIQLALRRYRKIDKYYAFEPYPPAFDLLKDRFKDDRVICLPQGIYPGGGKQKMYLHHRLDEAKMYWEGNSMIKEKDNVTDKYIEVDCIDLNDFLEQFSNGDEIILKIDIEGAEYVVFKKLLESPKIKLIKRLYCEWHWNKIGLAKESHDEIVKSLQDKGLIILGTGADIFR